MPDGNKRYLGDVLINKDNLERQRQFFRDVVDSYQYKYGGHFDAETLQGLSADDFATKEQGDKANNALLSPLMLGKSQITNINGPQFLLSDAIKLEPDTCLSTKECYQNDDDLTDALCSISDKIDNVKSDLNDDIVEYLEANNYNLVRDALLSAIDVYEENNQPVTKINADLVNGFRLIPITQAAYDELPSEDKNYWRNIYIIKDANQIANLDNQGNKWTIIEDWSFRVVNGVLCFNNGISSEWNQICPLADLLTDENIGSYIENYFGQGNNFQNIIKNISVGQIDENWDEYPFLSRSLHNEYISDITVNDSSNGIESSIDISTNLKKIDIDLESLIQSSSHITSMDDSISSNQSSISTLNTQMSNVGTQINEIRTSNDDQQTLLDSINTKLTNIQNSLNSLSANVGKWENQTLPGMSIEVNNQAYQSLCSYNRTIGIAYVKLFFNHFHLKGEAGLWTYRNKNSTTFEVDTVKARPTSTVVIPTVTSPEVFVGINSSGEIQIKSNLNTQKNIVVQANGIYRIGGYN